MSALFLRVFTVFFVFLQSLTERPMFIQEIRFTRCHMPWRFGETLDYTSAHDQDKSEKAAMTILSLTFAHPSLSRGSLKASQSTLPTFSPFLGCIQRETHQLHPSYVMAVNETFNFSHLIQKFLFQWFTIPWQRLHQCHCKATALLLAFRGKIKSRR
jgi:hypothetical protein